MVANTLARRASCVLLHGQLSTTYVNCFVVGNDKISKFPGIYAIGGTDGIDSTTNVQTFDPTTGWHRSPTGLMSPVQKAATVAVQEFNY